MDELVPESRADLEEQFQATVQNRLKEWRLRPFGKGYVPGQVSAYGALATVKEIVASPNHPLFDRVSEQLGAGSTLERLVLLPKYASLFDEETKQIARQRLGEAGWADPYGDPDAEPIEPGH